LKHFDVDINQCDTERAANVTVRKRERTKEMHKAIALADAVQKIPDGASVMIGGFLGVGSPH
jgi:hypothetical protein